MRAAMAQIGPYQVLNEIGKGGMAVVYRAVQPSLNRIVALKVLPQQLEAEAISVKRFRQEAETAASLSHEHIVKIWDASVHHPPYYIAQEFLEGGTLADRLVGGPLPLEAALLFTMQLCSALDHAHQRRIIHRDIKPSNILFDAKHRPVLTDFGIARASDHTQLTVAGAKFGTADYMSPEQAKGIKLDYRSDLYSLAVVFYEMICGRPPFVAAEPLVTMRQTIDESPPPVRMFNPRIPPSIEMVLQRALAKRPEQRYQSGLDFAQALCTANRPAAAAAGTAPTVLVAPDNLPPTPSQPGRQASAGAATPTIARRQRSILLALLLVVVAAALATIVTLGRPGTGGRVVGPKPPTPPVGSTEQSPAGTQKANPASPIKIPDNLTGQSKEKAKASLEALGLRVNVIKKAPTDQTPAGQVIGCYPTPRTQVSKGTEIELYVSSGVITERIEYDVVPLPYRSRHKTVFTQNPAEAGKKQVKVKGVRGSMKQARRVVLLDGKEQTRSRVRGKDKILQRPVDEVVKIFKYELPPPLPPGPEPPVPPPP